MVNLRTRRLTKLTAGDAAFVGFNYVFMLLVVVLTIYPFLNVLALSFSEYATRSLRIIPESWTLRNYRSVIQNPLIWIGYRNTIIRVVLGTSLSLLVMVMLAYGLSKRSLPARTPITMFIVFTMFFYGGLIPDYILIRNLGLFESLWALILPRLVDTFALIVMRNYFMTIPDSIEESARIDGATHTQILFRIVVQLSGPIIATVILWRAVWHWNDWFFPMIYVNSYEKSVLQLVLRRIVIEGSADFMSVSMEDANQQPLDNPDNLKAATIIFSTLPILMFYPFLQRYFVKGVVVGALKG
jgi:putative aldouronate transport system permease protein